MLQRVYKSGESRHQVTMLPETIEQYVDKNNSVRAIDEYVGLIRIMRTFPSSP